MSVCQWRQQGGGGVQDNASACDAAAEKLAANSKDRKDMLESKLKQGKKKMNRTLTANTCATSGQVWCVCAQGGVSGGLDAMLQVL